MGFNKKDLNDRVPFKDGEISIQASEYHYCFPKDNEGPYEQFEVAVFDKKGKMTKEDDYELSLFADDKFSEYPVYAYVPEKVLKKVLLDDGYTEENVKGMFKRFNK